MRQSNLITPHWSVLSGDDVPWPPESTGRSGYSQCIDSREERQHVLDTLHAAPPDSLLIAVDSRLPRIGAAWALSINWRSIAPRRWFGSCTIIRAAHFGAAVCVQQAGRMMRYWTMPQQKSGYRARQHEPLSNSPWSHQYRQNLAVAHTDP